MKAFSFKFMRALSSTFRTPSMLALSWKIWYTNIRSCKQRRQTRDSCYFGPSFTSTTCMICHENTVNQDTCPDKMPVRVPSATENLPNPATRQRLCIFRAKPWAQNSNKCTVSSTLYTCPLLKTRSVDRSEVTKHKTN